MIEVAERKPFLEKDCWAVVAAIVSYGEGDQLLISEKELKIRTRCRSMAKLKHLLDESRRRGAIAYRKRNGALLITRLIGDQATEEFFVNYGRKEPVR